MFQCVFIMELNGNFGYLPNLAICVYFVRECSNEVLWVV